MIIAIPVFNTRLSPLFDTAGNILLINWDGEKELKRELISATHLDSLRKFKRLKELNTDVLLCGAISSDVMEYFISSNIKIIAFLCGEFEEILTSFKKGDILNDNRFSMPGCCRKRRRYNRKNRC